MGGLGMWLRAETRRRWRAWLAVALIVGVGWGAVLTAVAGARRTQSAFGRFLEYTHAPDVLMTPEGFGFEGYTAEVEKLPQVESAGPIAGLNASVVEPTPPPSFALGAPFFPLDDRYGRTINRPKVLSGRLPDPRSSIEALVSPPFAAQLHIRVGDRVTMQPHSEGPPGGPPVAGTRFTVRIVGIGVTENEAFPITVFDNVQPLMLLTPAAWRANFHPESDAFDGAAIRLKPGASVAEFQRGAEALLARHPEAGHQVFVSTEADRPAIVSRAIRPLVVALAAFAAALGITLLLVMTQTITRQILIQGADYPALRALGSSPRQLTLAALIPAAAAVSLGALMSTGVAIAASPLTPIGAARVAEPHPGVAIDLPVLLLGAAAIVVALVGAAALPARKAARSSALGLDADAGSLAGRSRLADRLARAGAPAPASAGVRMALEPGRGRSAVPVRTVILGTIVSTIALSAAYTFGASLDRAVATPSAFGQRWDRIVDAQFAALPLGSLRVDDPSYEAVAAGAYTPGLLVLNRRWSVPAVALDQIKGSAFPTLLEGRAPDSANEIVLGTSTLRSLRVRVGGTVTVRRGGRDDPLRVVGRAVFPSFGIGGFTPTGLGVGAAVTVAGLGDNTFLEHGQHSFLLVRFGPRPAPAAVKAVDDLCDAIDQQVGLCLRSSHQPPPEFVTYTKVLGVQWILAGMLAALAAATLTHGLLATVRRRRRDLALLKTLGFVRRQVSSTVAWQATTLVAFALVGLPVGVVAGRWAWTVLATQLGIAAQPRVPVATIALTVPAALLLANLVAAVPARAASRTQAALVLRTE